MENLRQDRVKNEYKLWENRGFCIPKKQVPREDNRPITSSRALPGLRVESVNPRCRLSVAGQGSGPCRCHTCSSPSSVQALDAWPGQRRGPCGHRSACTAQPHPALRSEQAQPRLTVFQATHSVCGSQRAL